MARGRGTKRKSERSSRRRRAKEEEVEEEEVEYEMQDEEEEARPEVVGLDDDDEEDEEEEEEGAQSTGPSGEMPTVFFCRHFYTERSFRMRSYWNMLRKRQGVAMEARMAAKMERMRKRLIMKNY